MQGPNVKRLIAERMSQTMSEPARTGGIGAVIANMARPGAFGDAAKEATAFVEMAIAAVKAAPDNPYGDDDEAIAGEILRGVEAKKAEQKRVQTGDGASAAAK